MLLPSALTCDSTFPTPSTSKPRYQHASALFASPPLSPPPSSTHPAITNLYSTCRALQSMLSPPPVPSQLPSPPTTHALTPSPFKLRLRARKEDAPTNLTPRKKITKRAAAPPRGLNKRRRAVDDELSRETAEAESEQEDEEKAHPSVAVSHQKSCPLDWSAPISTLCTSNPSPRHKRTSFKASKTRILIHNPKKRKENGQQKKTDCSSSSC